MEDDFDMENINNTIAKVKAMSAEEKRAYSDTEVTLVLTREEVGVLSAAMETLCTAFAMGATNATEEQEEQILTVSNTIASKFEKVLVL